MLVIPLQAVPSQKVSVTVSDQNCEIAVRQLSTGLYVDLYKDNSLVIGGVIVETNNVIVRDSYLGFIGDIVFEDTQPTIEGSTNPFSSGLGSRFFLVYLTPSELPAGLQ